MNIELHRSLNLPLQATNLFEHIIQHRQPLQIRCHEQAISNVLKAYYQTQPKRQTLWLDVNSTITAIPTQPIHDTCQTQPGINHLQPPFSLKITGPWLAVQLADLLSRPQQKWETIIISDFNGTLLLQNNWNMLQRLVARYHIITLTQHNQPIPKLQQVQYRNTKCGWGLWESQYGDINIAFPTK